jgi:hypothetical protein
MHANARMVFLIAWFFIVDTRYCKLIVLWMETVLTPQTLPGLGRSGPILLLHGPPG